MKQALRWLPVVAILGAVVAFIVVANRSGPATATITLRLDSAHASYCSADARCMAFAVVMDGKRQVRIDDKVPLDSGTAELNVPAGTYLVTVRTGLLGRPPVNSQFTDVCGGEQRWTDEPVTVADGAGISLDTGHDGHWDCPGQ